MRESRSGIKGSPKRSSKSFRDWSPLTPNVQTKGIILSILLMIAMSPLLYSASYTTIGLDDPVYTVLDALELPSVVGPLPFARPYQRSTILRLLRDASENTAGGQIGTVIPLSDRELEIVQAEILRLTRADGLLIDGSLSFSGEHLDAEMGLYVDTLSSVDLSKLADGVYANTNYANFFLSGDIGEAVSYGFDMAFAFNYADPRAFTPYEFSADWDGYTYNPESIGGSGSVESF